MAEPLKADYLVIGAGAMGMAFVDTIVSDTQSTIILIDRYDRPGGHWTLAYPYVRLHQPSAFYGVNSRHLGSDRVDEVGGNKGLCELATGDEVCAYYGTVMRQTLLPSGRVAYFPKHRYLGEGKFESMVTGKTFGVGGGTRIVDATCMKVKVPAMSPPSYPVAEGVSLLTPNDLTKITTPYASYTVIGAGKTGIDACLWLLSRGIDCKSITWIMPRDSWFLERGGLQPGPAFAKSTAASVALTAQSIMSATDPDDMFRRLEASRQLLRLDENIWPSMFRCATISLAELEQIKTIRTIIRKGRVVRIDADEVVLEQGRYRPAAKTLFIDCTADGLAQLAPVPVFQGRQIYLQPVRYCQQVFSAAFIAHVEATYPDEARKNELCHVVPHPDRPLDYLAVSLRTHRNGLRWASYPRTAAWLRQARLDWFGTRASSWPEDPAKAAKLKAVMAAQIEGLCSKLEQLLGQGSGEDAIEAKPALAKF